jgi:hypothetical protein
LSGVHYQGQGVAKLQGTGNCWIFTTPYDAANITINGLTFDNGGLLLEGTVTGLVVQGNTFQNLTVNHAHGDWGQGNAIYSGNGVRNSKFSGNTFQNLLVSLPSNVNGDYDGNGAMWFYGIDSTSIDHNTFDRINEGIKICFTNPWPSKDVYIGYNTFTAIHRMGMEIQGPMGCGRSKPVLNGPDTTNIVIEYNSFTKPLNAYWWTYPISLANPAPSGGNGAIIRYNYIVSAIPNYGMNGGPNGYGIEAGSANMQIYGNTVVGPWGTGITYDGSPNSSIHDNFLCGLAQGANAGIRWETHESANVSIKNNQMYPNSCPAQIPNPTKLTAGPEPNSPPVSKPDPAPVSAPVSNGTYTITNVYSGLVLDDPGFSVSSLQIIQWPANGGNNQKWRLTFDGAGYYTIENAYSGLYLTDNGSGKLIQALQSNKDSQLWSLKKSGTNYVLQNKMTGKVIDDPNFDRSPNVGIITWAANGGQNQLWAIK